jgi:hypothetical protein
MKKYYRNVFIYEVLSDEYLDGMDLEGIHYSIHSAAQLFVYTCTDGHFSGMFLDGIEEEVDEHTMARLLENQASDPAFLIKDGEGEDTDKTFEAKNREIIFIALHGDKFWTLIHHPVPVEVRMDCMQTWADENLLPKLQSSGYFKIYPHEEGKV